MSAFTVTLFDDAPVYGGAERYVELLATGFLHRAINPSVVLAREPALDPLAARLKASGIQVARLPRVPTLRAFRAFFANFRHLAWNRPRILHFNLVDPRACNGAIVAAKLAGHSDIVATNQLPQSPFDDLPVPRRHLIAMAAVKHHIVVSEAARRDLVAHRVPEEHVSVVHNCAPDPGIVTRARQSAARAAMGVGDPAVVVGFSGRLAAQKNPSLFLEAAALVARARPDVTFVIVGDGPERADLEAKAAALGITARVRFLGQRDDAVDLYAGFDVLAFTSRYEGIPFTILEAMGLGVPVVATRIPGMDEVVVDAVTGRLVDADASAIAAAILPVLADDDARAAMSHASRKRMLFEFSVSRMVEKTAAVYERVVGRA